MSDLDLCSQFFSVDISVEPKKTSDVICTGFAANDKPPGDIVSQNCCIFGGIVSEFFFFTEKHIGSNCIQFLFFF